MKRTQVDFSNHQLDIIENEHVLIHTLHINNSNHNKVVFINCKGVMTVTGDFGNWVFCREFHPSADGFVSDGYWAEKLRMASEQTTSSFCSEETMKAIKEYRENFDESISSLWDRTEYNIYQQDMGHTPPSKLKEKLLEDLCKVVLHESDNFISIIQEKKNLEKELDTIQKLHSNKDWWWLKYKWW